MTTSIIRRRPGGRTAATSDRVFAAALDLIASGGLQACSVQAVAEAAQVNRSTLYRRWPTRAALVLEAVAACVHQAVVIPDTGDLHQDLVTALLRLAHFLSSPVGRAAFLAAIEVQADETGQSLHAELWRARRSALAPMFSRAVSRGELAPDVDIDVLLATTAGAVYFQLFVVGEPIDETWARSIASTVVSRTSPCS